MVKGKLRRAPLQVPQQQQEDDDYEEWEEEGDDVWERAIINKRFLGNVLSGIGATNKRRIDTTAAAASTKVRCGLRNILSPI